MATIYVLNPTTYKIEGIVDDYVSCIWRPSYSEVGDFEVYLGANRELVSLFQLNHFLVRSQDVSVADGVTTYKKVMIIKNIELKTNSESGDFLIITGKELKYILHQRIVWYQTNLSGTAEDAIRQLIDENAINPTNERRVIADLELGTAASLTDTIDKQLTGDYVDKAISDICVTYNYGWTIDIIDDKLIVTVYTGLDRSFDQMERPYVVFSPDFDNLYESDYQNKTENYANVALVYGEGEGTLKSKIPVELHSVSGLDRFECYVDASSLSRNKGSDDEIPVLTYLKLLAEKGLERVAELQYTEGFSGEILSNMTFKYGVDFNLGDIVTVINSYGISKNVRVVSAIESDDVTGSKLIPQFNI